LIEKLKYNLLSSQYLTLCFAAVIYFIAVNLGTALVSYKPSGITFIWLPSGIGLIMMLKWGFRAAPFIYAANFFGNLPSILETHSLEPAIYHTLFTSLADLIAPVLGMILYRRYLSEGLKDSRDLLIFFICSCLIPLTISSLILSTNAFVGGYIDQSQFYNTAYMLFFTDSLGIIWIFHIYSGWQDKESSSLTPLFIASSLIIAVLLIIGLSVFTGLIYLITPILIFAAFGGDQLKVALLGFVTIVIIIVATANGFGPHGAVGSIETNIEMMAFIFAIAFTLFGVSLQSSKLKRSEIKQIKLQKDKETAQNSAIKHLQDTLLIKDNYSTQLELDIEKATLKLRNKNLELQAFDQQRSLFFTNISHEFVTPLSLIKEPIRKLGAGDYGTLSNKGYEALDISQRNINRLSTLIHELLMLAKFDAGEAKLDGKYGDINFFCKRIASLFNHKALEKNIQFSIDVNEEVFSIFYDEKKVEKVLFNLLSNAFKYTPENGEVSFVVSYEKGNEHISGKFVNIVVENEGVSINDLDREHIFNRFYRTSSVKTDLTTGTGIGLALVKELVELHGGEITVDKGKKNQGNLFTVFLPTRQYHVPNQEILIKEDVGTGHLNNKPHNGINNKHNVLIVEDNDDMRSFIVAQLDEVFNVNEANSGKEALKFLNNNKVDVVISDVMMPQMNGVELLKEIKTNHPQIPVILLTAKANHDTRILALKNHADDFLAKPFNTEELTLKVINLAGNDLNVSSNNHEQIEISDLDRALNNSEFLNKARNCVLSHIQDYSFDVKALADGLFMSRSTLQRKIENQTSLTAAQFIRHIRLEQAHQYIERKEHRTLAETAYAVGFKHPGYFSKLYRNYCQQLNKGE